MACIVQGVTIPNYPERKDAFEVEGRQAEGIVYLEEKIEVELYPPSGLSVRATR